MKIEDGTGSGKLVGVNGENRILTESISASVEHHVNHHAGLAFNVLFNETANNASSLIFYMKNSDDIDITIEGVYTYSSAAGKIQVRLEDTGTPSGTTLLTPVNCNVASGSIASGDFYSGTSILGVNGGPEVLNFRTAAAGKTEFFNFEQDIILPKNKTFCLYSGVSGIAYECTVVFNYHSIEDVG